MPSYLHFNQFFSNYQALNSSLCDVNGSFLDPSIWEWIGLIIYHTWDDCYSALLRSLLVCMQFDLRVFKVSSQVLQACDVQIKLQWHNSGQITTDDKRTLPILLSAHVGGLLHFPHHRLLHVEPHQLIQTNKRHSKQWKVQLFALCAPGATSCFVKAIVPTRSRWDEIVHTNYQLSSPVLHFWPDPTSKSAPAGRDKGSFKLCNWLWSIAQIPMSRMSLYISGVTAVTRKRGETKFRVSFDVSE